MGGGRPRRGEPGGARVAACRDCWSPRSCASLATSPKPESPQPRHGTMAQTTGCTLAAWPAGLALPSSAGPQGGVAANLAHTSGHGSAWPPTHFGYCATRPKPLCPDHRAAQSRVLWQLPVFCRGPRKFRNWLQAGSLAPIAACPCCRCHSEAFPSKLLTAIKLCLETVYCRSDINCSSCATVGKTLLATHDSLRWLRAQPQIANDSGWSVLHLSCVSEPFTARLRGGARCALGWETERFEKRYHPSLFTRQLFNDAQLKLHQSWLEGREGASQLAKLFVAITRNQNTRSWA